MTRIIKTRDYVGPDRRSGVDRRNSGDRRDGVRWEPEKDDRRRKERRKSRRSIWDYLHLR